MIIIGINMIKKILVDSLVDSNMIPDEVEIKIDL